VDNSPTLLVWVLVVSGLTTGILIAVVAVVFGWHQRRLAGEAERWGQHVLAAQDAERHHIARELHDDVVHRIAAARLAIDRDAYADASAQLGEVAESLRSLARDLHPAALEYLDLSAAIEDLVSRHRSPAGPHVTFMRGAEVSLPGPQAVALYRVAQEGLMNAIKHAAARTISLSLEVEGGRVTLLVVDDGRGLPADIRVRESFGLRSMRERIKAVRGTLELSTPAGGGTRLAARVSPA
jgi:two-component system sensor histidine kinase UhpB